VNYERLFLSSQVCQIVGVCTARNESVDPFKLERANDLSILLKAHLDSVEKTLISQSGTAKNSGHSLHKGSPRESFIREFLEGHLSERVAIGTGEIIDVHSEPDGKRNQHDIIIYRRSYPKIDFGGHIYGFMAESVIATIEVKSTLKKDDLRDAVLAAHRAKSLERNSYIVISNGYQPPSILSYVVAYNGPAHTKTVYGWLSSIHNDLHIPYPVMGPTLGERLLCPSPSLDSIFVLGKGFVQFDNSPLTFGVLEQVRSEIAHSIRWRYADMKSGNLLLLFLSLTAAINSLADSYLQPNAYLPSLEFKALYFGD